MEKTTRKATHPLCHTGPVQRGHTLTTPWVCRVCEKKACAGCAHHFGTARSVVSVTKDHERFFTCSKCSRSKSAYRKD